MKQAVALVTLVVRDYDEALDFYVGRLGFRCVEGTAIPEQNKRWVVVEPPGPPGCRLLLAQAVGPEQIARIGDQTGGRVFLFLYTDDFWRDYEAFRSRGVRFIREPARHPYGTVAVFEDLYGNLWDLLQPTTERRSEDDSLK
jgi:catechol 2,3-dioxygenase-like lactoylglutathione lyase family enzyme